MMRIYRGMKEDTIHSVCSLGKRLDDELPVLLAPSAYLPVRVNNGSDVIHDIFFLSSLVMEGDAKRRQRFKNSLYVDLRSTRGTYMQSREAQTNEIVDKIEDLFSWGRQARIVRTLVECVKNEVNGALIRK